MRVFTVESVTPERIQALAERMVEISSHLVSIGAMPLPLPEPEDHKRIGQKVGDRPYFECLLYNVMCAGLTLEEAEAWIANCKPGANMVPILEACAQRIWLSLVTKERRQSILALLPQLGKAFVAMHTAADDICWSADLDRNAGVRAWVGALDANRATILEGMLIVLLVAAQERTKHMENALR